MTSLRIRTLFTFFISTWLISCNSEEKVTTSPQVKFIFSQSLNQFPNEEPSNTLTPPAYVLITITNTLKEPLLKRLEIPLSKTNETYESSTLALPNSGSSDYILTEYAILDNAKQVLFVAPIQGSAMAQRVDKPLGIKLTLEQSNVTIVSPEVVRIDEVDLPYNYGYDLEFSKQSNIIYKNLNDGKSGYNQSFAIDIDSNGFDDYAFTAGLLANDIGDHLQFRLVPLKANRTATTNYEVTLFQKDQSIEPTTLFQKLDIEPLVTKTITATTVVWSGEWAEVSNQYIGICFFLSDDLQAPGPEKYYGWIRVSFNKALEKIIIHDMAYMNIPDTGIKAGVQK